MIWKHLLSTGCALSLIISGARGDETSTSNELDIVAPSWSQDGEGPIATDLAQRLRNAIPVPMPGFDPSDLPTPTDTAVRTLDVLTGVETVQPVQTQGLPLEGWTPGYELPGGDESLLPNLWAGEMNPVDDQDFPWSIQCRLIFDDPSTGLTYLGSGTLISARVVITAGHCLHKGDGSTWYTNFRILPAWDGDDFAYGSSGATQITTFTGWTDHADFNHDMGFIRLDRPVGFLTGWIGYGYATNDNFYKSNLFNLAGYPAGCYSGTPDQLYYGYGNYDTVSPFILTSEVEWSCSTAGVSGAGSYWINNGVRYVHGVHSHRCYGCNPETIGHTRLEASKYDYLANTYVPGSYQGRTPDYLPLDVNARTPRQGVTAGHRLSSMDYLVANLSTNDPGRQSFTVDVYLSVNDNISPADTLIQSHTFSWDFDPLTTTRVIFDTPPRIPAGTPSGDYWVGVIVTGPADPYNDNDDSDGWDASPIRVIGCEVIMDSFGEGFPGSGGHVPSITGIGNSCDESGHRVEIDNGLGGASGLLFVGVQDTDLSPNWGGHFYVDPSQPWVQVPITLGGALGQPGAGHLTLPGTDKSGLQGLTLYMQALFLDPDAEKEVSSTNGLSLIVEE